MKLEVNGETEELEGEEITINELLEKLEVDMPDMVSVELNGDVLSRSTYDVKKVTAGDEVEFLYFMGGG